MEKKGKFRRQSERKREVIAKKRSVSEKGEGHATHVTESLCNGNSYVIYKINPKGFSICFVSQRNGIRSI